MMNNIVKVFGHFQVNLFADDMLLSVVECIQKMQEDLDALFNWNLMSVRPNL
jgi:hypothetical protein